MATVAAMPVLLPGLQNQERNWVYVGSARNVNINDSTTRTPQTKLLFNEAIPVSVVNRATRVGPPAPIVIERLLPRPEMRESPDSLRSFSVLSEERLQAAVKLAKRDLRRRNLGSLAKTSPKHLQEASVFETSDAELLRELAAAPGKQEFNIPRLKEKKAPISAKQRVSQKNPSSLMPAVGQSPPTRDLGLRQMEGGKPGHLSNEIRKLQNELEKYIRKVEELADRGEKLEESLEPEEQIKLEIRRQKQAARSARIIYVLQRQVKEIQDDIEKLKREKMWETKKSVAVGRLAAAHRGALRALQVIIHQLSDRPHSKVPPHFKELGQLIRQLSLCSVKVEVDQGSAVPETALDILQKLEILDSALSKHEALEKLQAQTRPPRRTSPHRSTSPATGPHGLSMLARPHRPANPRGSVRGGRKVVLQKLKPVSLQPLVAGVHNVGQQRELQRLPQPNTNQQSRRHPGKRKADVMKIRDAGFRQPTVSSQLRVSQLPQREKSVPWIPTSPRSPPQQQTPQRWRPEPRCLFSPVKPPPSPPGEQQAERQSEPEPRVSAATQPAAPKEATRTSYQEKMTTQLSDEEAPRIQRLRSEVVFQNQWTEEAEQGARADGRRLSGETLQEGVAKNKPERSRRIRLPAHADEMAAGDHLRLVEHQEEDLLKDAWAVNMGMRDMSWRGLQASTLESMLLRMEEIQREEEVVRRRFASIAYSDPLYWDRSRATGSQPHAPGSRPASPQPIRLTRPALKQTAAADIILEKPIEAGFLFESSPTEVQTQDQHLPTNKILPNDRAERSRTVLSVPGNTLKNIRQYKEDYNSYLGAASPGPIDSFNPWAAADSVAAELLSEALADVAKEFQDVVEEYAEAVFTSEFLQPVHSVPPSAPAVAGRNQ
ncbi:protein moonraker isoform X2 [Poeciliopsis prolifica]|uniref:protein moonraker isoform X2 n=1 Tax=Poeciliopsis prolifica TaxID=188132 RepID=UPI002412F3A3|nr:protein moonraker isoform X2 [Poeciliopsis prolifica]